MLDLHLKPVSHRVAVSIQETAGQLTDELPGDVGLHVLGCRVDILGTNCKKLLKLKVSGGVGGGGERVALASVRVTRSGGQQGAYCWIKNTFCRQGYISLPMKNEAAAHSCRWAYNEGSIH